MKRGKHPTTRRRKQSQRRVKRYMELREDLQVAGRIPVEPAGAVRDERVNPSTQSEPADHLGLAVVAARNNWATPDEVKPNVVDNLGRIATGAAGETVIGEGGKVISTGPSLKTQVYAAKVLAELDQIEYERQHPEEAGKAKGATKVNVGVAVNNVPVADIGDLIRKAREQREAGRNQDGNARDGTAGIVVEADKGSGGGAREEPAQDRTVGTLGGLAGGAGNGGTDPGAAGGAVDGRVRQA